MPAKSKKGGQFEREFAKLLSLWWSDGSNDDWFWRSSASGARATQRAKAGKTTVNSVGDICAQSPEAHKLLKLVTIELKRGYNDASLEDLLDKPGKPPQIAEFIVQAIDQSLASDTPFWMLVRKRDRRNPLVYTNMPLGSQGECTFTLTHNTEFGVDFTVLPLEDLLTPENKHHINHLCQNL